MVGFNRVRGVGQQKKSWARRRNCGGEKAHESINRIESNKEGQLEV